MLKSEFLLCSRLLINGKTGTAPFDVPIEGLAGMLAARVGQECACACASVRLCGENTTNTPELAD